MNGTFGQMKIYETIVREGWQDKSICREVEHYLANNLNKKIDEKAIDQAIKGIMDTNKIIPIKYDIHRVYLEKQCYDVFTNPNTSELLARAKINEAVVYGVATDYCVKAAVLGMQQRGIKCYVVEDAIKGVFPESTKNALEEMVNAGARLVTTKDILGGKI
jgi:nicotinamidase-related amidase